MWGTRQNFWVLIMKNEFFLGFLIMKNEFIELVFLWTRFPCGAWLTKSCLIKNLAACGFAWSDIWLRLHLCFHTWKTSSINSLYDQANHGNFVRIKHHRENEFKEKRVQWTRFPYMETEFIELGFCATLPSSLNSISVPRQFSRKSSPLDSNVINEISLKLCLTYNIVWVLWLF